MLPTAGVPFLAHLLARIRAAGVDHVVLATSLPGRGLRASTSATAPDFGLELDYVAEDEPLGTGGGIRNVGRPAARRRPRWCFNGDILSGST